ncbi:uncharacterized protein LOC143062025 [Mytilus galloprovincialis]|uniref:uncharacterized protein LOC143062025 n=1 Tax=Mytilus galloprovincialis TaxID=29158 RepID=UPI003F7BD2A7
MGNFNCKGKISKESRSQMRGEAYRPSKPDPQGKETIPVVDTPVNENGKVEDAVVTNTEIPFVTPETPTKSESVMQGPNTSVSDTNGLKANDSMGKRDKKQHESDTILQKPVQQTSKDELSSANIKNNSGEETNLKEAPPTGISLNKEPDYKSDDEEIEKPGYLFSKGVPGEEAQTEDFGFTNKITGIKDPLPTDQSSSSRETVPTEKAKDEDKKLTIVDGNVLTKTASGNVSEPTVENKSNQSNEHKHDSTEKPSDKLQPGNTLSDSLQPGSTPSDKLQPGNTPSDKLQPGNTPSDKLQPGSTPSDKLQPGNTPSDKLQPENAPSDKLQPGNTPSDKLQPGNTPSDKLRAGNTPSDKLQPENAPSDKLQPGNTPSDKLQPENAPSDKLQPENAPSDNQQNNSDSTGYNHSKFSNPCDEQDKKMSKEMKKIDGKKKKKKKKKPDKYDPLPTANIQNYYGYVDVVNIGNDVVNIVQKEKEVEKDCQVIGFTLPSSPIKSTT